MLNNPILRLHKPLPSPKLDVANTALLVIDMQYYSAHRDYGIFKNATSLDEFGYYFERLKMVTRNIRSLQDAFRSRSIEVIHFRIACLTEDGRDRGWRHKAKKMLVPVGSKEAEFLEEVKPVRDEIVIPKTSSGIFTTNIDQVLRNLGIEVLVFCGVITNQCVETSIREAADWSYKCILAEDCCATFTQDLHEASIRAMKDEYASIKLAKELVDEVSCL